MPPRGRPPGRGRGRPPGGGRGRGRGRGSDSDSYSSLSESGSPSSDNSEEEEFDPVKERKEVRVVDQRRLCKTPRVPRLNLCCERSHMAVASNKTAVHPQAAVTSDDDDGNGLAGGELDTQAMLRVRACVAPCWTTPIRGVPSCSRS